MRVTIGESDNGSRPLLIAVLLLVALLGLATRATVAPRASSVVAVDPARSHGAAPCSRPAPGVRAGTKFEVLFCESEILLP